MLRSAQLLKRHDFIKTYNAVDVNYERIGFRKLNGAYIDASSVVNASALSAIQSHYALARPPPPPILDSLLEAGSIDELELLIDRQYSAFLSLDSHEFVTAISAKFGESALNSKTFVVSLLKQLETNASAQELVQLMKVTTEQLGFPHTSPVVTRLAESVGFYVNDFGLLDSAKLLVSIDTSLPVWSALSCRLGMLIDGLLFNESGSNVQLVKKFANWSLVDFCQLVIASRGHSGADRLEQLIPYVLYEQVLNRCTTNAIEATVFVETVKHIANDDEQLIEAAILSAELFNSTASYHQLLTEVRAHRLDEWFELIEEDEIKLANIGSVYAFLRGEDIDYINASLYTQGPTTPDLHFLDS